MVLRASRTLGLSLGILFLLIGVHEVATHLDDTADALAFTLWTLVIPIFAIVAVTAAFRDRGPEATRPAANAP